jgi:GntR family transcriptional regulator
MVHLPSGEFMPQSRRNGLPAYKRIQGTILKRLESGQLKPGQAVSSERELARIHSVRGAGTFVAPPRIHFNKLMSYTEQMLGRGLAVSSRLLSLSMINTEQEIAARLALPATSGLIKVERLRLGANEPFAIETCYLSAKEFDGLTQAPLDRVSLFSILEYDYGLEIAHADEEIDATTADPHTARLMGIPHGSPVLRIRQEIYSTKGKVALYVLGLYRSDRHTLLIRRFR